jgi:hypothetical protein
MLSHTTPDFWNQFSGLPQPVQEDAKKAFRLFLGNPAHPGLEFKKTSGNSEHLLSSDRRSLSSRR